MKKPPSLTSENPPEFPPPRPRNPRNKKSRDSPCFSECNCCNNRINYKNPKNRFEILKSEWRIVILCKNCYNLVEKSEICSYCLIRVSSEFYDCVKCRHRIHKDCAENFPYDFSGNFCFDCWIPKLLENEFNRSRKIRKKQLGKNRVDRKTVSSSRLGVLLEKENSLEDVVNEAEKTVILPVEAKENAFRKKMEHASDAVGIVAIDEDGEEKDGELTMNRSIDEDGECVLNSHCVDVPKVNEIGCFSRGKIRKKQLGKNRVDRKSVSSSRLGVLLEKENSLENVVNEAEKTVILPVEAKENAFRKILVDEDGELAMNCSFKVSRDECLHCVDVARVNEISCFSRGKKVETVANCMPTDESSEVRREFGSRIITYSRKRCVKCKEESDCALKLYSKKPSQVSECKEDTDCALKLKPSQVLEGKEETDCALKLKPSLVVEGKEETDCALKLYSRKPSQAAELEAAQRLPELVNLEAGKSLKYSRRRFRCKSMLGNGSLNRENGNRVTDMLLTCREESMSLANAT